MLDKLSFPNKLLSSPNTYCHTYGAAGHAAPLALAALSRVRERCGTKLEARRVARGGLVAGRLVHTGGLESRSLALLSSQSIPDNKDT